MITRNQIMDALQAVLETMPSIVRVQRRYQDFTKTSASADMPLLMLCKPKEIYPQRATKQLPATRTFTCEAIIVISPGLDQESIPDETVCDILDELDIAMQPPTGEQALTLGGLVSRCYIEGEVICVPGDLDGLGMIHAQITIVVP